MDEQAKQRVQAGRQAMDAYRLAHRELHAKGWHQGIDGEHKPLLDAILSGLKKQGFAGLDEFTSASLELNIEDAGLASSEDFEAKATEEQRQSMEGMWQ